MPPLDLLLLSLLSLSYQGPSKFADHTANRLLSSSSLAHKRLSAPEDTVAGLSLTTPKLPQLILRNFAKPVLLRFGPQLQALRFR
jgi:hypothetical protein